MKGLLREIQRFFRLESCIAAVLVLVILGIPSLKRQQESLQIMRLEEYPEEIGVYDAYSVRMLFEEFLLQTYGTVITSDDRGDIERRYEALESQLVAAAKIDERLLRTETVYQNGGFVSSRPYDAPISNEDEEFIWALVNGQAKLEGMDHPVFFLKGFEFVKSAIEQKGLYHVLGPELIGKLSSNLSVIFPFIYACIVLIIPYCVAEKRSRTEALLYTTKTGRGVYLRRLLMPVVVAFAVTVIGVELAVSMFSQWGIDRYYNAVIDSAVSVLKAENWGFYYVLYENAEYGITYLQLYALMLLLILLFSLGIYLLTAYISLKTKHVVTAFMGCLPLIVLCMTFQFRYIDSGLGYDGLILKNRYEPYVFTVTVFVLAFAAAGLSFFHRKAASM